jgi:formiminotetrahydrofolate cyclodeaminase
LKLRRLIAEDARAFERIRGAYKLRKVRTGAWQSALKNGSKPPMRLCRLCLAAAALAKKERARTSAWLESDRREGVILLRAAFEAGVLNVLVNLKGLRDRTYAGRTRRKLRQWRRKLPRS